MAGYLAYSGGDLVSGEGFGGQLGLGLFGAVNVEPACSRWYRSQVSGDQMKAATTARSALDTPIIAYDWRRGDYPTLGILNAQNEIVHSDLNAVIEKYEHCTGQAVQPTDACGKSFREFTAIFHDEATVDQAFAALDDEDDPIHAIRDGMGINYGISGLGSMVLANRAVGPDGTARRSRRSISRSTMTAASGATLSPAAAARLAATAMARPRSTANISISRMPRRTRSRRLRWKTQSACDT